MCQLRCYLFGQVHLKRDGRAEVIKSRKGIALLAYLAASGRPVEREMLAALLWPDFDAIRGRANLRRTLIALRQLRAADWLIADQHTIALSPEAEACIDLVRFLRHLAVRNPASQAEAVALYRGEFLAGFYLPDNTPFEEWAVQQRALYQRRTLRALDWLAAHHLNSSSFGPAVRYARQQLDMDDLRETAWRQLMAGLAGAGRRAEALAEFQHCRQVLKRELGLEPAAETIALAAAIQSTVAKPWRLEAAGLRAGLGYY